MRSRKAKEDDDGDEERELRGQDMGEVGLDGGGAPHQDGQAGARFGSGDDVVAQTGQQRRGLGRLGAGRRVEVGDRPPSHSG